MPPPRALYLSEQEHTYAKFKNYPVAPKAVAITSLYQTNLGSKTLRYFIAKKAPNKTNQNQPKPKAKQKDHKKKPQANKQKKKKCRCTKTLEFLCDILLITNSGIS